MDIESERQVVILNAVGQQYLMTVMQRHRKGFYVVGVGILSSLHVICVVTSHHNDMKLI